MSDKWSMQTLLELQGFSVVLYVFFRMLTTVFISTFTQADSVAEQEFTFTTHLKGCNFASFHTTMHVFQTCRVTLL